MASAGVPSITQLPSASSSASASAATVAVSKRGRALGHTPVTHGGHGPDDNFNTVVILARHPQERVLPALDQNRLSVSSSCAVCVSGCGNSCGVCVPCCECNCGVHNLWVLVWV